MKFLSLLPGAPLLLLLVQPLSAAPVPVTTITVESGVLTGLTLNGEPILPAQFIPATVTTFLGGSAVSVVAPDGPAPASGQLAGLLGDHRLDTGLINPALSATAITCTFPTPVINRPGPDLVVMELNAVPGTDGMQVRINGVTQTASATLWGNTGITIGGLTEFTAGSTPANLAALQAATLSPNAVGQSLTVFATALELSDFGIAAGASVSSLTLGSSSSTLSLDPVLVMGISPPVTGGPVINEIVAANDDGIEDEDTNRPDWIEIYNGSAAAVNLSGWTLTDDPLTPAKWPFPSINVPAWGHIFVFASGKNRFTNLHAHTNFTLPKAGGVVMLSRPDASPASTLIYGPQQDDVSYGSFGGDQARRYFETPTPGTANSGRQAVAARVEGPVFSRESGPITSATTLAISLPPGLTSGDGAVIRYSLNGSEPTETSLLAPASLNITSGSNVAARVFLPGHLPSLTYRRSFVFLSTDIGTSYTSTGAPFSSNLPVLVLDSFNVAVDSTTNPANPRPYRFTQAMVYDVDPATGKASLGNAPSLISRAATHVRGQSSSGYPQRPYALEFWKDTSDTDKNVALLGMPADSDWVLQTLYTDKTFQRNHLMQQLMMETNGAGPGHRSRFVEVFFNQDGTTCSYSDYRGVYLVMERIKRGNNRLRIEKLNREMTETSKLSGGYIFRKDKTPWENPFTPPTVSGSTWNGLTYDIVEPEPPTTAQKNWLQNYINQTDIAVMQSSFATPSSPNYYARWLDPASFIDKQIFMETCKESDSYIFSYYYYKDRGQPLKADLIWDVDRSLGNSNYGSADNAFGWRWWTAGSGYAYLPRLFQDPEFTIAYWDRWWSLRQGLFSTASLMARIENNALLLTNGTDPALVTNNAAPLQQNPAARHFRRYATLGANIYAQAPIGQVDRNTYRKELDYMKTWLTARLGWIDTQSPLRAPDLINPANQQPLFGGAVSTGQTVQFHNPNAVGTVLYTVNGADPRQTGGAIHASALTASATTINIAPVMPAGQAWKWLRPVAAPSATWKDEGFADGAWATGTAPLGYGESSGLTTNISPTAPNYTSATTEPSPVYLRRTFDVTGLANYQRLRLELQVDDGAVVYLNGVEAARSGYPYAPTNPSHTTEASGMIDDSRGETAYNQIIVSPALLREGTNTIAVQVHQGFYAYPPTVTYPNNSYSDMRFDLRINGLSDVPAVAPTTLTLSSPGVAVVRSRVKNGITWSGLTESAFVVQTVPATAENLVVSEFHYRPAAPTPAETTAGFTTENAFEFLELLNIHPTASLDLAGLEFTQGITFDFDQAVPETRYLPPGGRVLLVSNRAAFLSRYPAGTAPVIAGTYAGNLSNGGETLTLRDATGTIIKSFAYDNNAPWPTDADGLGRSLALLQPGINPDHRMAWNWQASVGMHGTPGSADPPMPPPADPLADHNQNGLPDLIDYVLGPQAFLGTTVEPYIPESGIADSYLIVRFPRELTASAVSVIPEMTVEPGGPWSSTGLTFVGWDPVDGTRSGMVWRSTEPVSALGPRAFIRLRTVP